MISSEISFREYGKHSDALYKTFSPYDRRWHVRSQPFSVLVTVRCTFHRVFLPGLFSRNCCGNRKGDSFNLKISRKIDSIESAAIITSGHATGTRRSGFLSFVRGSRRRNRLFHPRGSRTVIHIQKLVGIMLHTVSIPKILIYTLNSG